LALAHAPVAQRIDKSEQLVENGAFPRGVRHRLVKGLERNASDVTFGVRPYGWQITTVYKLISEWRGCICRRNATGDLASLRRKCVFHSMYQELLYRPHERAALALDQMRSLEPLERVVHLRWAEREICGDLGDRRPDSSVADQLQKHNDVLRQQSLRHSTF